MRITRHNEHITIRCSLHEFDILSIAVDQIECGDTLEFLPETGLRRSWSRRTNAGSFLRVDKDKRSEVDRG